MVSGTGTGFSFRVYDKSQNLEKKRKRKKNKKRVLESSAELLTRLAESGPLGGFQERKGYL